MTSSFAELSEKMPVFSDLQNIMDMTVVATLIVQEGLAQRAGVDLSVLSEESDALPLLSHTVPKAVDPQCSFIRGRSGWVVTASGGVDINAFDIVEKQTTEPVVAQTRTAAIAAATSDRWWWNQQ